MELAFVILTIAICALVLVFLNSHYDYAKGRRVWNWEDRE